MRVAVLLALSLILSACAGTAPVASKEYRESLNELSLPQSEAGVYLFVTGANTIFFGMKRCAADQTVKAYIDGQEISTLKAGNMAFVRAVPGTHRIAFQHQVIDMSAGDTYSLNGGEVSYFHLHCGSKWRSGRSRATMWLKRVSEQRGIELKQESELLLSRQRKVTTQAD